MSNVIDIDPLVQQFIDEYMIDGNGSRAARAIGIPAEHAASRAYALLTRIHVRDEIQNRIALRRADTALTQATLEGYMRDVIEVNLLDIFDHEGCVKPLVDIPLHAQRAIKTIKRTVHEDPIWGDQVTISLEMKDSNVCLRMLGQYKKMFIEKVEIDANVKTKVVFAINGIAK